MSIIGIEKMEFGVADMPTCEKFLNDFGLTPVSQSTEKSVFTTLSGASVVLYPQDNPTLPVAFESGPTLRRITWGLDSAESLAELSKKLQDVTGFRYISDGEIECQDPNGMTLRLIKSQTRNVELPVSAINQWGDIRRIDEASPLYEKATPINIGHVVFFVEELEASERFYCDQLGFQVSDRYTNRAVFLRAEVRGVHHNLFLLKIPGHKRGLNHVAFTVRDIHEVIGGGLAMNRHKWSTFIGPGRHPISSAYFWYVNSPTGGAFEYYTNDDYLTEKWQPREIEHSVTTFTEWAVEGGIDFATRRQVKKSEEV